MKTCILCGEKKHNKDFRVMSRNSDGLSSRCRECSKEYDKRWYRESSKRRNDILERNKRVSNENRRRFRDFLKENACIDCGEDDIVVLELDHVRGRKHKHVSDMIRTAYSWKRIMKEIAKCVVRCANCHRRKTAERSGNWFRS